MKKIIEKLRDSRGMTMVEVVVSLMITSIVLIVAGSMYLTGGQVFSSYAKQSEYKQMADRVDKLLTGQLAYATTCEVSHDNTSSVMSNHNIKIGTDGRIYVDGEDIYKEDFYDNCFVNVYIKYPDDPSEKQMVMDMKIVIADRDGNTLYTERVPLRLINIESKEKSTINYTATADGTDELDGYITNETSDTYIYYKLKEQNN